MTDSKIKKIRDRIRKLLNMAGDAGSPNEAAIAAKRAKALLAEYNLSEADVIAGDMSAEDFREAGVGKAMARYPVWMNILGPAIAQYTGCHSIFKVSIGPAPRYQKLKQIQFRGHVDDLMLAEYLWTYLTRTIERMTNGAGVYGVAARNSFKKGMAGEICKKLREMADEEKAWFTQHSDSRALVVVDKKAAMLREKYGIARYSRSSHGVSDGGAHARGRAAGADVSIRRGLQGTSRGATGYLK